MRRIDRSIHEGWHKWEIANLWGWTVLKDKGLDLTGDWPLYTLNHATVSELEQLEIHRATLSPEDDLANLQALLPLAGDRLVLPLYQDTPLFLAEPCPKAALQKRCRKERCCFEKAETTDSRGHVFDLQSRNCRTVLLNRTPLSISHHLPALREAGLQYARIDFVNRSYSRDEMKQISDAVMKGKALPDTHEGNLIRGLL